MIHSSRIFRNSMMSLRKQLLSKAWGLKVKQIVDTFENLRFQLKKVCQIVNTFEKVILKVNTNWWVFEGRMPKVWYIRHRFSKSEGCPYENHHFWIDIHRLKLKVKQIAYTCVTFVKKLIKSLIHSKIWDFSRKKYAKS